MRSTYKITITSSDSFGRYAVYDDSTVADMAQLLNQIAGLDKYKWNVTVSKGRECPHQVNIDIKCQCKENWAYYTIRIEDGEASE